MSNSINDQISDWLQEDGDYNYGVSLFSQICRNRSLLKTLLASQSSYNQQKVKYELDKYLKSISYVRKEKTEKAENIPTIEQKHDFGTNNASLQQPEPKTTLLADHTINIPGNSDSSPHLSSPVLDKIAELTSARNNCYAQRDYFHPQLSLVTTDEERFVLAGQIRALSEEIVEYNKQIDLLREKNSIPLELQERNIYFELQKKIDRTKIYIRRHKLNAKRAKTVKERDKYLDFVDKYENKLINLQLESEK